ncbi:MAG: hypothetical protein L0G99_09135, partial [Propionibacteriales bacterium]|nr:hypothetical protein [Propionibacteriales bacterium]
GLWWMIVSQLAVLGVPVVEVAPTSLKKYATGKGNAGKDEVILRSARRYGNAYPCSNNDEADAFILAAMGMRHLGHPIEDGLPQVQVDALAKVRWPV